MKRSHLILWLPCLFYYAFITFLSGIPSTEWAGIFKQPFPHFDKVVHFFLYAFLGMVLSRALSWEEYYHHLKKRWYIYFALIIPFVSFADEIHQYFVPHRSMNFFDWLADIGGAFIGGLFYIFIIRGRRGTKKISELEAIDVRSLGLILAMFYFVVLVSLNLFDYKLGILKNYSHLAYVFSLIEYGFLGLLTIRFFYLRRGKKNFDPRDWIWLALFGSIFILFYQCSLLLLKDQILMIQEVMWAFFCYILGALCYYLDKQIEKFRQQIWDDPFYKQKTWQRLYFFIPPLVIAILISYLSTQTPQILYDKRIPLPTQILPSTGPVSIFRNYFLLHTLQFFTFGLFYFRAIAWESWWHEKNRRKWVWIVSYLIMVLYAVGDEVLQYYIPGRVGEIKDVTFNIIGATLALGIYLFGYRIVKEKYFSAKMGHSEFEV